jgi:hypothetical protein
LPKVVQQTQAQQAVQKQNKQLPKAQANSGRATPTLLMPPPAPANQLLARVKDEGTR